MLQKSSYRQLLICFDRTFNWLWDN